jgi:adenosine deaminase
VVAVDIAGPVNAAFRFADYRELFAQIRRAGLGVTVHAGETGGPEEVREAVEALEPSRIGHGVRSAQDPAVMAMLRERGVVLEVCPSSNLNTRVIGSQAELKSVIRALVDNRVRFALSTDGPEMLRSYLRDEIAMLLRQDILTLDEVRQAMHTAEQATFVGRAPVPGGARNGKPGGHANHAAIALEVEV